MTTPLWTVILIIAIGKVNVKVNTKDLQMNKRTTMKDVADQVGVSVNTVSRALNDKPDINSATKRKILKVADELNYHPNRLAQGLRRQKSGVIGVIVADIANPYFSTLVKGLEEEATTKGYSIILQDTDEKYENEVNAIETMIEERVDGIVLSPVQTESGTIRALQDHGVPFVLVARRFRDIKTDYVISDEVNGAFRATKYLLGKGHQKIAFINGPVHNSSAIDRLKGFKKAFRLTGLEPDEAIITHGATTTKDGKQYFKKLYEGERNFSAVFTFSDYVALGVLSAAHDLDICIPDDLEVVGYDDIEFSSCLNTPLPSVKVPKREMGRRALDILLERITKKDRREDKGGERKLFEVELPTEFIQRS